MSEWVWFAADPEGWEEVADPVWWQHRLGVKVLAGAELDPAPTFGTRAYDCFYVRRWQESLAGMLNGFPDEWVAAALAKFADADHDQLLAAVETTRTMGLYAVGVLIGMPDDEANMRRWKMTDV